MIMFTQCQTEPENILKTVSSILREVSTKMSVDTPDLRIVNSGQHL